MKILLKNASGGHIGYGQVSPEHFLSVSNESLSQGSLTVGINRITLAAVCVTFLILDQPISHSGALGTYVLQTVNATLEVVDLQNFSML